MAQGTIKILVESDFSSNLTHFLTIIGGSAHHWGGGGGARALPKRYKVTPLSSSDVCFSVIHSGTYLVQYLLKDI